MDGCFRVHPQRLPNIAVQILEAAAANERPILRLFARLVFTGRDRHFGDRIRRLAAIRISKRSAETLGRLWEGLMIEALTGLVVVITLAAYLVVTLRADFTL
ncbi:hypothetical protein J2Z31_004777 [Sinorhizobium kostiense]|uniref:Uncharacterized protein n=1 Tax=Sinorhizobium kostiense TaxID=76747 RepID=A0ABS4R5S9_9HYPH|nr:hypothetical protein [Sinorhizobium kostiense]MBP2238250.1 hypothetical protein [Sinorhizobium kostiense]